MANGTYANAGLDLDTDSDGLVNSVLTGGPFTITKTADGGGGNTDPLVLDAGDQFQISGLPTTWTYVGTDGTGGVIAVTTGGSVLWLSDTPISVGNTVPASDGANTTICFAAGTLIATPEGETVVEALQIGDLVTTADGRVIPVKWIGRQTVLSIFAGDRARPVRVAAGALGEGLPHTDLVLTADHALILEGLAINAGALVNGTTITRDPAPASAIYYHVETEGHEVILANGAPAESYIDYVGRQAFDNHAEHAALYGDTRTIAEMPLPRITATRNIPAALLSRLNAQAAA